MKWILPVFFILLSALSNMVLAQDRLEQFWTATDNGDTAAQHTILLEWQSANSGDADLYASWFSYYFGKSQKAVVAMANEQPDGQAVSFQDSSGNIAGYWSRGVYYDSTLLHRGLDSIDQGLAKFPHRLDMRFGKIYALGQAGLWEAFTQETIKAIHFGPTIEHKWTWTRNEEQQDGETFFLGALQDYQLELYNANDDALLPNMRRIGEAILKYYPEHIESINNISITYILEGNFAKAVEYAHRAEKVAPDDSIVLCNLGRAYALKGDKEKAIGYFQKVMAVGGESEKQFAQDQIDQLSE